MSLENIFRDSLKKHYHHGARVVLGLSGGLDSRVLLELMAGYCQSSNIECLAVHVHHGLSDNAEEWARLCEKWCQQYSVSFVLERVQLKTNGRSLEESAREARYTALSKHLNANDLLLTGQHADDQLETFFLALKRGSGPRGLSSMAQAMPFGQATLVRPLLTVSRQAIEEFGNAKQLEWVEDESNQDQRFDRNFVRHSVTPVITERWPHIRDSIQRAAELCAEQELLLEELLSEKYQYCLALDGGLNIEKLSTFTDSIRSRILRMWIGDAGLRMPSREQLNTLWREVALAQSDANPQLNLPQAQIRRYANRLYVVTEWQSLEQFQQPIIIDQSYALPSGLGEVRLVETKQGNLSRSALNEGDLRIIFNPEGLSAHPVERGHSRKLKKLFQEYGVPSWLRRRTPILMCSDRVVAVGTLFIDRNFKGQDCELIWDNAKRFM